MALGLTETTETCGPVGSLIISMMTCLDDFEEETGLFLKENFRLSKHVERSDVLEIKKDFEERSVFEDQSDILVSAFERKALEDRRGFTCERLTWL